MNRVFLITGLLVGWSLTSGIQAADETREAFSKSYQYERSQSYADAIKVLLAVKEKGYVVDLRLGWLYYLSGNFANAKQHYQAAMDAAPSAVEPLLGYTLPLLAQERYEEVELVARNILIKDPNNYTGSLRLTIALRMQKKYEQAYALNAAMLVLYPTDVSFLSEQLLVTADKKISRDLCEVILKLDPENIAAKRQLAALNAAAATTAPATKTGS